MIVLLSHLLRIFFWLAKPFDVTILYQSLSMIFAQLLLLDAILAVRRKDKRSRLAGKDVEEGEEGDTIIIEESNDEDLIPGLKKMVDVSSWNHPSSHMLAMLFIAFVLCALQVIFQGNKLFIHFLGASSAGTSFRRLGTHKMDRTKLTLIYLILQYFCRAGSFSSSSPAVS